MFLQGDEVSGRVLVIADGATSKLATKLGYCTEPAKGICSRAFIEGGTHNANFDGERFFPMPSMCRCSGWLLRLIASAKSCFCQSPDPGHWKLDSKHGRSNTCLAIRESMAAFLSDRLKLLSCLYHGACACMICCVCLQVYASTSGNPCQAIPPSSAMRTMSSTSATTSFPVANRTCAAMSRSASPEPLELHCPVQPFQAVLLSVLHA